MVSEEMFFQEVTTEGNDFTVPQKILGWRWNAESGRLNPLVLWEKKKFLLSGSHFRLGEWDQFERVDFLHRLCRLFYHDVNGKVMGFDGMIQIWRHRMPDEATFKDDLLLLEQSVHHLKKLNLLMDAGTDLNKISEFNIENAVNLLDGLTQRVLGITQPIEVSGLNQVKGAAGYVLFLIWSFVAQISSLSTSRSNWRLVLGPGFRFQRDFELCIQSDGLPSLIEILKGVPQYSRFNRWLLMRLAANDLLESRDGELTFAFNGISSETMIDQFSVGSENWMCELFRASLVEKKPAISDEKSKEKIIQVASEILF